MAGKPGDEEIPQNDVVKGLKKRDYFAIQILAAFQSRPRSLAAYPKLAQMAVECADMLIEELEKVK